MLETRPNVEKCVAVCACWGLLLFATVFVGMAYGLAENYRGDHFTICSDLDPRYVQFVKANAEAYYENLQNHYFQTGWGKPLTIYYSETQSDTQQLLNQQGYGTKVDYGLYKPDIPAIYTHRFMDNGELNGWDTLFREITRHFIQLSFNDPPEWFSEGLACFLGEQTQIVNGKITLGRPNPRREQILRNEIEQNHRPNIKRLFSSSKEQFYEWDLGCHFARAFFYWLHETGQLKPYLKTVQKKGYELSVLEETVSKSYGRINISLLKFIKRDCYAGAYMEEGLQAKDEAQKKQAFLKALELKPDYQAARLELAAFYYRRGDYEQCRENLRQILNDPKSVEYQQAAKLMANTYYNRKNYAKALEYYKKTWECSGCYEYKHRIAYQIGNCFYYLKDREEAKRWYKEFLDFNWERESMKSSVDYAQKCLGYTCETVEKEREEQ